MTKRNCVLIIEDELSIREFMGSFLDDEGYCYATAENGQAALELLKTMQPGLIILDMFMPVLDGKGFIAAYLQLPVPHAPIVGMSANAPYLEPAIKEILRDFIHKPFHLDLLLACVQQYVGLA